jgi:predicted DnaQ family exonuclease/DinG family helicase
MKLLTPPHVLHKFGLSRFVCLDFETTGFQPETCEIIEVGAVKIEEGVVTGQYHSLASIEGELPESITFLTGISEGDLQGQPSVEAVMLELVDFMGDCPLAAHNLGFDLGFLKEAFTRFPGISHSSGVDPESERNVDSLLLARILLPRLRSHSLESLVELFAIESDVRHRALDDALAEFQILDRLLLHSLNLPNVTLAQLLTATRGQRTYAAKFFQAIHDLRLTRMEQPLPTIEFDYPDSVNILSRRLAEDQRTAIPFEPDAIVKIFEEDGILHHSLDAYEYRREQVEMSREVCKAYNKEEFLMVEAGTGTGKSWAYLVPAIYWSQANPPGNGRTVISTNTKNLQEQIFHKDIPFLYDNLPADFQAVLLKGRHNYVCLHRWNKFLAGLDFATDPKSIEEVLPLIVWVNETNTGDIEECSSFNQNRSLQTWWQIRSDAHFCRGMACPAKEQCFVNKIRRAAREADLVVVNHSLLLSDLISDMAILSDYENLIIDEAHNFENIATQYLGLDWSNRTIPQIVGPLDSQKGEIRNEINVLLNLLKQLAASDDAKLRSCLSNANRVRDAAAALRQNNSNFFQHIQQEFIQQNARQSYYPDKFRYKNWFEDYPGLEQITNDLLTDIGTLRRELDLLVRGLNEIPVSGFLEDKRSMFEDSRTFFQAMLESLSDLQFNIKQLLQENQSDTVYWVEISRREDSFNAHFRSAPLQVAPTLKDLLYGRLRTSVFTSATLSIDQSFEFFLKRLGVDLLPEERRNFRILGSPFDYESQIRVLIPGYLPDPRSPVFIRGCADLIRNSVLDSRRGTLVLFTSYDMLNQTYERVGENLRSHNMLTVAQGKSGSRNNLLKMFRDGSAQVLLGTQSFWEGVDVPGEALEMLIITKIPFEVPTEPVAKSRAELIEANGGNSFYDYTVPNAVLRFRQGFGRLIRSKSDRGIVLLLDSRMVSSRYGSIFLNSMPVEPEIIGNQDDMLSRIKDWFSSDMVHPPEGAA